MALIKCTECGREVSDKASVCPNCGAPVVKTIKCEECGQQMPFNVDVCPNCGYPVHKVMESSKQVSINKTTSTLSQSAEGKRGKRKARKIIIGVSLFALFFSILYGNIHEDSYTTEKSSAYDTEKSSAYDTEESSAYDVTENEIENDFNSQESDNPNNTIVGTYEFSDNPGWGNMDTWVLMVNNDETAVIYNKSKGGNVKCYGSWYKYKTMKYASFAFFDKAPIVWFPSGRETLTTPRLTEDWIYYDDRAADAKNPEKRIPVKKVK